MLGQVALSDKQLLQKPLMHKKNYANDFRRAVTNIVPNCNKQILDPSYYSKQLDYSIYFHKPTSCKIYKTISKLNTNKAPETNKIKVSNIKMLGQKISTAFGNSD